MSFSAATFAARLKEARTARGLTQAELAVRLGGHQEEVASFEGGRRVVGVDTATRLADVLYVALDWLAGRTTRGGPGDLQPPRRRGRK